MTPKKYSFFFFFFLDIPGKTSCAGPHHQDAAATPQLSRGKKTHPKVARNTLCTRQPEPSNRPHSVTAAESVYPAGEKKENPTGLFHVKARPAQLREQVTARNHRPNLTAITAVARPQSSPIVPQCHPSKKRTSKANARSPKGILRSKWLASGSANAQKPTAPTIKLCGITGEALPTAEVTPPVTY